MKKMNDLSDIWFPKNQTVVAPESGVLLDQPTLISALIVILPIKFIMAFLG